MSKDTEKSNSSPDESIPQEASYLHDKSAVSGFERETFETVFEFCLSISRVEMGLRDLNRIFPKNDPYIQMILDPVLDELPTLEKCREYLLGMIAGDNKIKETGLPGQAV